MSVRTMWNVITSTMIGVANYSKYKCMHMKLHVWTIKDVHTLTSNSSFMRWLTVTDCSIVAFQYVCLISSAWNFITSWFSRCPKYTTAYSNSTLYKKWTHSYAYRIAGFHFHGWLIFAFFAVSQHPRKLNPRINRRARVYALPEVCVAWSLSSISV